MRDQDRPSRGVMSHCVLFFFFLCFECFFFFGFVKNFEEIKEFLGLKSRVFATKDYCWLGNGNGAVARGIEVSVLSPCSDRRDGRWDPL